MNPQREEPPMSEQVEARPKRFDFTPDAEPGGTWRLRPADDGEWMRFSEHRELLERVEGERDALQGKLDGRKLIQHLEKSVAGGECDELPDALAVVERKAAEERARAIRAEQTLAALESEEAVEAAAAQIRPGARPDAENAVRAATPHLRHMFFEEFSEAVLSDDVLEQIEMCDPDWIADRPDAIAKEVLSKVQELLERREESDV
jgi:hypothetical protein